MAPSGRVVAAGGSLLRRNRKAALELTDEAARRVRELLQAKGETVEGVRISLRNRGCNGKSFVMNYVEKGKENKHDEVVLDKGVKLFVDPRALMQVVGTTMDFVDSEISSEFVFYNPNAKNTCGCGESFNV
jgi:iron-sulfur cluster assembly accessory protein